MHMMASRNQISSINPATQLFRPYFIAYTEQTPSIRNNNGIRVCFGNCETKDFFEYNKFIKSLVPLCVHCSGTSANCSDIL